MKIILFDEGCSGWDSSAPAGDSYNISNLVARNNRCGVTTYLVEARCQIENGNKKGVKYFLEEGPYLIIGDRGFAQREGDPKQELPTKRQIQEAEFWAGYYWPNWECQGAGLLDPNSDIIEDWAPGYSLKYGLATEAKWTDDGFFISIVGPASNVLNWIWNEKKGLLTAGYPGCDMDLHSNSDGPYAISVRIDPTSMSDLIKMEPKDKWDYGEMVYGEERKIVGIVEEIIDAYPQYEE